MTFNVEVIKNGLKVYSKVSKQQTIITDLELEEPNLLSRDDIEIEIRRRVAEKFECDPRLEFDEDSEKKICIRALNNEMTFESE